MPMSLPVIHRQRERELYIARAPEVARALLEAHINDPASGISPLDFDVEAHPAQDPMLAHIDGEPLSIEDVDRTASIIDDRFPAMVERADEGTEAKKIIHRAGWLLENGYNITVVTPHVKDITDIGFAPKIFTNLLYRHGYEPEATLVTISKALAYASWITKLAGVADPVKLEVIPTLQTAFDRTIMTWPKTDTSGEALGQLPQREVDLHNKQRAIPARNEVLDRGGTVEAMAATGTTRLVRNADGAYVISPMNSATARLLGHPKTYVLPMLLWRQSKDPVVKLCGYPTKVDPNHPEQADGVMQVLADNMNELIDGMDFVYGQPSRSRLGKLALGRRLGRGRATR